MWKETNNVLCSKTLDYFLQLTETMNYTQAAQILGITQPALTQQIKKLERSVGTPLFYSVGKKLQLTEAGHTMVRTTHSIYTILSNASDEIQKTTNSNKGEIKIGILSSIEDKVLTQFVIDYYKKNPEIKIAFYMLSRDEIWNKLEKNKIDLAVMYLPDQKITNWRSYDSKKIINDELLFLHQSDDFKQMAAIRLNETTRGHWTMYPNTYYLNDLLREEFKKQLIDWPEISGNYSTPHQIYTFSQATKTLTALPKSYIITLEKLEKRKVEAIPFDPPIEFQLSIVFRKDKLLITRIEKFLFDFELFLNEEAYSSRLKS